MTSDVADVATMFSVVCYATVSAILLSWVPVLRGRARSITRVALTLSKVSPRLFSAIYNFMRCLSLDSDIDVLTCECIRGAGGGVATAKRAVDTSAPRERKDGGFPAHHRR